MDLLEAERRSVGCLLLTGGGVPAIMLALKEDGVQREPESEGLMVYAIH